VGQRTMTLVAGRPGDVQPGRPIDWDQLPPDARAWADEQAGNGNEILTVLDGDRRAALGGGYDVYVVTIAELTNRGVLSTLAQRAAGRSYQPPYPDHGAPAPDDASTAVEFAARLLDPGLSPQAFARKGSDRGAEANSMWYGAAQALAALGLRPGAAVGSRDLATVLSGRHAQTGAPALPGGSGIDLVFAAPNSVSIVWSQVGAQQRTEIESAMLASAITMLDSLVIPLPLGGRLLAADSAVASLVLHAVGTRSADGSIPPILHVHGFLLGVWDDTKGLTAVDEAPLYEKDNQRMLNALAALELANRLRNLGWPVRNTGGRGNHTFEIAGVPQGLLDDANFWKNTGCAD
jgi:hypothetical protein